MPDSSEPQFPNSDQNAELDATRRNLLIGSAIGLVTIGLGWFGWRKLSQATPPEGSSQMGVKVELGKIQTFEAASAPTKVTVNGRTAFVLPGANPHVISGVCTHAGCDVDWNSAQKQFVCPCHNSQFSESGAVVHGPASEPLANLAATVEDDTLYVQT